jgi:hypothetical protein
LWRDWSDSDFHADQHGYGHCIFTFAGCFERKHFDTNGKNSVATSTNHAVNPGFESRDCKITLGGNASSGHDFAVANEENSHAEHFADAACAVIKQVDLPINFAIGSDLDAVVGESGGWGTRCERESIVAFTNGAGESQIANAD